MYSWKLRHREGKKPLGKKKEAKLEGRNPTHVYADATFTLLSSLLATEQPSQGREAALISQEADNHREMR